METVLIYLVFANICFAVLFLFYRLLMRNQENFALNRWIMVSILCVSVLIPLIPVPNGGWFNVSDSRPLKL